MHQCCPWIVHPCYHPNLDGLPRLGRFNKILSIVLITLAYLETSKIPYAIRKLFNVYAPNLEISQCVCVCVCLFVCVCVCLLGVDHLLIHQVYHKLNKTAQKFTAYLCVVILLPLLPNHAYTQTQCLHFPLQVHCQE